MANISLTTLYSNCQSPNAVESEKSSSVTTDYSPEDIPKTYDQFWSLLGCTEVVARCEFSVSGILKCKLERKGEAPPNNEDDDLEMDKMFMLTYDGGDISLTVRVNPEKVRQEIDYYCIGKISRQNSEEVSRDIVQSLVRLIGSTLRLVHKSFVHDCAFGLVTVCFESENRSVGGLKSPVKLATTKQEMVFDNERKCKILTMKTLGSSLSAVNYGVFVNRHLQELRFITRYHTVPNVSETVLRLFPSVCVSRFEPFIEHCDLIGVISRLDLRSQQEITIVTTVEHDEAHTWPMLEGCQPLRLLCELEDCVLNVGLMIEVKPEISHKQIDYNCKGTLLGGFFTRSTLKEWTDVMEAAVAFLHDACSKQTRAYGQFKISFYGDYTSLKSATLFSPPSPANSCKFDIENESEIDKESSCNTPVLTKQVVVKTKEYQTLVLKKKMILKNGNTIFFKSRSHFDLVGFVRLCSENTIFLELMSLKRLLDKHSRVVWPRLDSRKELVLVIYNEDPIVVVVIPKRKHNGISYFYGLSPLGLDNCQVDEDHELVQDIVENVITYFHDKHLTHRGILINGVLPFEPADAMFKCLNKIILKKTATRRRWSHFWHSLLKSFKQWF